MCTERYIDQSSTDFEFQRMFEKYEAYQLSLKRQRDSANIVSTAREEGREEGIHIGIDKEKQRMAREMKQAGEPIPKIILYTHLTEQEISKL
ncbi:MAG: hypothetical protein LUD17_05690 [Bacteroidales bacterium]|nr:hypothetical protein [Bacteroidales bacterium]